MFRTSLVSDGSCSHAERITPKPLAERLHKLRGKLLPVTCLAVIAAGLSGCTTFSNGLNAITHNGYWNDAVIAMRNRSFSAKAWHRRKHNFCREKYLKDFCAGFRAGYEDVANGRGECTPAFPPAEYWGWEFQSAEGQGRTSAWFAGYPHGARAAEEEGLGHFQQLPMSLELQAQYQQAGTFQHQGALYPIPDDDELKRMNAAPAPVPMHGDVPMEVIREQLPPGAVLVPEEESAAEAAPQPVPIAPAETGIQ